MEKLVFETNLPIELALNYTQGKRVQSQYGGEQQMFSSDKGVFYVAGVVGDILSRQLEDLDVKPGDPIRVCKREIPDGRGRKAIRWQVERIGEQPDGTFVVPKVETHLERQLKASIDHVEAKKVNGKPAPEAKPAIATGWAQFLLAQSNALVDVFAAAVKHAGEQHGNLVRPDDVRTLVVTAYIQQSKGGTSYGDR
jgi:hypothetical protein